MNGDSTAAPSLDALIVSTPGILGGRPVFRGTRVPVESLFENFADGLSLDQILDQFRALDRGDVVRVLELTTAKLTGSWRERIYVRAPSRATTNAMKMQINGHGHHGLERSRPFAGPGLKH